MNRSRSAPTWRKDGEGLEEEECAHCVDWYGLVCLIPTLPSRFHLFLPLVLRLSVDSHVFVISELGASSPSLPLCVRVPLECFGLSLRTQFAGSTELTMVAVL